MNGHILLVAPVPQDIPWVSILRWSAVMLGGVVLLAMAAKVVKRWATKVEDSGPPVGFTLGDLRDMHQRGELSDEEFAKAKAKIVKPAEAAAGADAEADDTEKIRRRVKEHKEGGQEPPQTQPPDVQP